MDIPIEKLKEQLSTNALKYEDWESCFYELKNTQKELQNLLEYASDIKKDENKFKDLHRRLAGENTTNLIENLRNVGDYIGKDNSDFGKAFTTMGYRLLEQTRAGKRGDVYHGILRIFVSYGKPFRKELVEAFKPIYSEEMFKVFIFSFLSGIIGKEKQTENKN